MPAKRHRVSDKYRNPPVAVPKVYSAKEIKARWAKKTGQIETLANHIQSLKYNITRDLKSEDEKTFLTAVVLSTMIATGERVGNSESANAGHRGVTGFLKSQVTTDGNKVTFRYTGKSGVKQEKVVTDEKLASNIRKALKMSDSKYLFCTSEGFCIKADRVNRYLKDFDVTAKDIRGYSANRWIIERLRANDIPKEEKERKKLFLKVGRDVASRIGHGLGMLRKQYLIPDLESLYIEKGKIVNIKDGNSYSHGGSVDKKYAKGGEIKNESTLTPSTDVDFKSGGKISQNPAPKEDKIYGSKVNEKGSSKNIESAKEIKFDDKTLLAIHDKVKEHNEHHTEKKVTLASAKAVVRRGMGAYSSSHRPTISGGKPNSRVAWGLARLNAFLYKIVHGKSESGNYIQDDDLINELGYKVRKYAGGGAADELIAPNGKISNLPYEQYLIVRTPEFIRWFGDWINNPKSASKILDENGEPKVLYHGSSNKFNQFTRSTMGELGEGMYFTTKKSEAQEYADRLQKDTATVYSVFLRIVNPFIAKKGAEQFWDKFGGQGISDEQATQNMIKAGYDGVVLDAPETKFDPFLRKVVKTGNRRENILALYPEQIKLADGTNTEFDINNIDIRYAEGGEVDKIDDEKKETYKKWKELVNMSASELQNFYDSPEGEEAGMKPEESHRMNIHNGRQSARWILRMKKTPVADWSPAMWVWAKRQIAFISRMGGNKGALYDEKGRRTRKHTSLLIWGHNPKK